MPKAGGSSTITGVDFEKRSSLLLTHERQYETKTLIIEEFRSLKNTTRKLKDR